MFTGVEVAKAVFTAAVASTAFIQVITPHVVAAKPRRSIDGHTWALMIGGLFSPMVPEANAVLLALAVGGAVGGSMFAI